MKWYIIIQGGVNLIVKEETDCEPTTADIEFCEKYFSGYYGVPMTVTNVYSVRIVE